jgi:hypothetical protein
VGKDFLIGKRQKVKKKRWEHEDRGIESRLKIRECPIEMGRGDGGREERDAGSKLN